MGCKFYPPLLTMGFFLGWLLSGKRIAQLIARVRHFAGGDLADVDMLKKKDMPTKRTWSVYMHVCIYVNIWYDYLYIYILLHVFNLYIYWIYCGWNNFKWWSYSITISILGLSVTSMMICWQNRDMMLKKNWKVSRLHTNICLLCPTSAGIECVLV